MANFDSGRFYKRLKKVAKKTTKNCLCSNLLIVAGYGRNDLKNFLGDVFGVPTVTMEHTVGGIYVVRNPLDMVMSMSYHYGISHDEAIEMLGDPEASTGNTKTNAFEFYRFFNCFLRILHHLNWYTKGIKFLKDKLCY